MKRFLSVILGWLLIFALMGGLTSCKKAEEPAPPAEAPAPAAPPAEAPPAPAAPPAEAPPAK